MRILRKKKQTLKHWKLIGNALVHWEERDQLSGGTFYCTNLSRARLQNDKVDALMGWRKGLKHIYDKPEVEELVEEYVHAIDLLTTNDEDRLKAKVATLEDKDKTIQELTKTVEEMKGQTQSKDKELVQRLRQRDCEIEEMRKQMAKMQDSQLKIIESLNNPAMVSRIRANPQDLIAAANAADEDTANYIKRMNQKVSKSPSM